MRRNFDPFVAVGAVLLFGTLAVIGVMVELAVWNECRATHSLLYCWRVMG